MPDTPRSRLGGLFATARQRAPVDAPVAARAFVLTCVACGAPRTDGSDAQACAFCGGNMVARPTCRECGRAVAPAAPCPHCEATP